MPLSSLSQREPVLRLFALFLAAVVLLLACMNVANLLLVRGTVRQRELAIRAALGSGRARLIRQALTESLLLAMLGVVGGLILGKWASDGFAASIDLATDLPTVLDFSFDWRVFGYSLAAAAATGLLIGIWPAIRASRTDAGAALHEGSRGQSGGPGRQRVRSLLVVGQVAGSLVLLIVAGLFMRGLQNAQNLKLGFAPDRLLNVRMDPTWAGYSEQRTKDFYRELERRVAALPGVQSASLAFSVPMGYYNGSRLTFIEGRPVDPTVQPPAVGFNVVDAPYFDTLQTRILRGRAFTESDDEHAPLVAIVNQTMAARYWPNQDPIGKRFRTNTADAPPVQVIGVAEDGKYLSVSEDRQPYLLLAPGAELYVHAGPSSPRRRSGKGRLRRSADGKRGTRDSLARPGDALERSAKHAPGSERIGRVPVAENRREPSYRDGSARFNSCHRRSLRRGLLRSSAAHPRDWHSHGHGSAAHGRAYAGAESGRDAGSRRHRRRAAFNRRANPRAKARDSDRRRRRSLDVPRRHAAADHHRSGCLLYPRAPRDEGGTYSTLRHE